MYINGTILKAGRVVDPLREIDQVMDIAFAEGKIVAPEDIQNPEIIDCRGKIVAPGFIDLHVHLRSPGNSAAETIASGTMAAAAGGFTAIVAMPNTKPAADTTGTIELIRSMVEESGVVKVHLSGCMTTRYEGEEMTSIGSLKAAGVIALTDDGRCVQNHELMRHIVEYAKSFQLPILDHCEDISLMAEGVMHEGVWSVLLGMKGISAASEELIVARDIMLVRMTDWKIHLQHISTTESVEQVRQARKRGFKVSAEATPHHMALTDECIKRFDTNYKMNPPLRSEADRQAVIAGLADGTISVIATDHAPHTMTAKLVEFDDAPFGIIGLETAVPITLGILYHSEILSALDYVAKFTTGPAEVLGFENYSLAAGNAADITIIDPDLEYTVNAEEFKSKSRNTPFNGEHYRGRAVGTIVDGKLVYELGLIK
ncbi:MAG: dihydroorotase [Victivallaceae bacterium]